jgi:hypothetical protein
MFTIDNRIKILYCIDESFLFFHTPHCIRVELANEDQGIEEKDERISFINVVLSISFS